MQHYFAEMIEDRRRDPREDLITAAVQYRDRDGKPFDMQELLITRLVHLARIAEARQQYESCRIALRRHLDMDPPARLRALEKLLY